MVHALLAGHPMCGFTHDPPQGWPASEAFIRVDDDLQLVSCELCLARAEHWVAKKSLDSDIVARMSSVENPNEAVDLVIDLGPLVACAIIDSLNHAMAGILLAALQTFKRGDARAVAIVIRAQYIRIRGCDGPVAARDAHLSRNRCVPHLVPQHFICCGHFYILPFTHL